MKNEHNAQKGDLQIISQAYNLVLRILSEFQYSIVRGADDKLMALIGHKRKVCDEVHVRVNMGGLWLGDRVGGSGGTARGRARWGTHFFEYFNSLYDS